MVTSRNRALRRITSGNSLEVVSMEEEEAASLFLKSVMLGSSIFEETKTVARSIVITMGHIPLAIDQAGAYIMTTGCDLEYYLTSVTAN